MTFLCFGLIFGGLVAYGFQNPLTGLWENPEFRFALGFTLKTTLLATGAAVLSALPCAYQLARTDFRGKAILETLLDLPIVLPPLVSGVALLILCGPLLGATLTRFGFEVVFSERGVVVAQWFMAFPFAVKTFRQAFESVDRRYESIARTLGYTPARLFFRVAIPMAGRGLANGTALAWARTVGEFGATAMLAGVTRLKTETLAAAIFLNMSVGELRLAVAIAVILFLAAMVILAGFRWGTARERYE
jgi:molybdate transport system permease protein